MRQAVTTRPIKSPALSLTRLVLRAGADVPKHTVAGAITVQCLEGERQSPAARSQPLTRLPDTESPP